MLSLLGECIVSVEGTCNEIVLPLESILAYLYRSVPFIRCSLAYLIALALVLTNTFLFVFVVLHLL